MGASGSGKSTLLSVAGGLDEAHHGEVIVEGNYALAPSAEQLAALRRRTWGSCSRTSTSSRPHRAENVTLPLELDGFRGTARVARAGRARRGRAGRDVDRFPDDLSGGQQQRVAIARAVVGGRRLILADEPTGALDSVTGESVLRMLRARVDAGAAGILVTHEARHAAWADRIVFLRDGRIVDEARCPASTSYCPHRGRMKPRYRRVHPARSRSRHLHGRARRDPGARSPRLTQSPNSPERSTMAARMARIRIALTIARRTSIRAVGRSALIAAMVALPIGGLTAIGIVYDSGQASVQERITTELGQTQAALHVVSPPSATLGQAPDEPYAWGHINADGSYADSPEGDLLDPADVLPAGTRILALSPAQVTASTATGTALFPVTEGPSWDESFSGHYDVAQGRVPRTDHEVMATASLLTRLGIEIGGTVQLHSRLRPK